MEKTCIVFYHSVLQVLAVWIAQRPPGFGFVLFEDPLDAKDAVKGLDGGKVAGYRLEKQEKILFLLAYP